MQVSTIQELVTGYEASLKTCDLFGPCGKFLWICINYGVITNTIYGSYEELSNFFLQENSCSNFK